MSSKDQRDCTQSSSEDRHIHSSIISSPQSFNQQLRVRSSTPDIPSSLPSISSQQSADNSQPIRTAQPAHQHLSVVRVMVREVGQVFAEFVYTVCFPQYYRSKLPPHQQSTSRDGDIHPSNVSQRTSAPQRHVFTQIDSTQPSQMPLVAQQLSQQEQKTDYSTNTLSPPQPSSVSQPITFLPQNQKRPEYQQNILPASSSQYLSEPSQKKQLKRTQKKNESIASDKMSKSKRVRSSSQPLLSSTATYQETQCAIQHPSKLAVNPTPLNGIEQAGSENEARKQGLEQKNIGLLFLTVVIVIASAFTLTVMNWWWSTALPEVAFHLANVLFITIILLSLLFILFLSSILQSNMHSPHITDFLRRRETKLSQVPTPKSPIHSVNNQPFQQPTDNLSHAPEKSVRSVVETSEVIPPKTIYDYRLDPENYEEERVLHPHEKRYPHSLEVPNSLIYDWQILGASRRGYGHSYDGEFREDDFAIRTFTLPDRPSTHPHAALIALSDGVGSRSYSRYGASAAVEGAINLFEPTLQEEFERRNGSQSLLIDHLYKIIQQKEPDPEQAKQIVCTAVEMAYLNVLKQADELRKALSEPQIQDYDLHSTLLVFLVIPLDKTKLFIASTQVGDGALFARITQTISQQKTDDLWQLLQPPQIQESGNEVIPLLRSDQAYWQRFANCITLEPVHFIMGMTDGTADDIEPPHPTQIEPKPEQFVYVQDFYKHIKNSALQQGDPAQGLLNFLSYRKPQSYDDRTVVCIYKN